LRKQKDLSQTELGQRAGLHDTHSGRFERLPGVDKHVVKILLDAFLTKKQLQTLMR
jgi:hypothetical protein